MELSRRQFISFGLAEQRTTVTATSPLSGVTHHRSIPLSEDDLAAGLLATEQGVNAQDAFPSLSADDREYLMTGIMPYEWEAAFGEEQ